jgi:hypothetical protein
MIEKKDPGVSPAVWQEQDGWHVRVRHDGEVRVFATRDEAISYSTSTFTDGATAARAETQRGDVAHSKPAEGQTPAPPSAPVPERQSQPPR